MGRIKQECGLSWRLGSTWSNGRSLGTLFSAIDHFRIIGLSEAAKLLCYQMTTLKADLQEDAIRTLRFWLKKLTHHTFKNRSSSRKRISVVAGLAIAKGNVVFTERDSHHGNTESKKEGQGLKWQYPFSTTEGEKGGLAHEQSRPDPTAGMSLRWKWPHLTIEPDSGNYSNHPATSLLSVSLPISSLPFTHQGFCWSFPLRENLLTSEKKQSSRFSL